MICRLDSGMAGLGNTGLFDPLGESASDQVSFDAQSTRDDQRILVGRRLEGAQVPESVRAVLREGPPIEGHVIGLDRFCAHGMLHCGHYERGGEHRQVPENKRNPIIPGVPRLEAWMERFPSAAHDFR